MMKILIRLPALLLIGFLFTACSSTSMLGSWSSPDYKGQIENVYIIGISSNENSRRIFEDTFGRQLASQGVKAVSSYKDLPGGLAASKQVIIQMMTKNGCDSVLLTKLISQRKETVTTPGSVSGYSSGSYYGDRGGYGRSSHYRNWGSYYNQRTEIVYHPATTTEFTILTVESVLYDLKTEGLIWSAQLETYVEGDINKMMQDFAGEVTTDLEGKGLL
jgi:hypothetical protein